MSKLNCPKACSGKLQYTGKEELGENNWWGMVKCSVCGDEYWVDHYWSRVKEKHE